MPTHSDALPSPVSLSVVNKQMDQTSNDSTSSSQNELAESERLPASPCSNIGPRSFRGVRILDLADELLLSIFDHLADSADIRNIRLTCRRFCSTSSHLLLDCLNVHLTASSLARAKKISCHPTISKGIRVLHISLRFTSHLSSASKFRSLAIRYLQQNLTSVMMCHQKALKKGNVASFPELQSFLSERQRLLSSWSQYKKEPENLTHQQGLDVEILHRGYKMYQMAYEWQKRAIQDGTFAQAIAAAVGQMPRASKLLFTHKFRHREMLSECYANMWKNQTSAFDVLDDRMMLSISASRLHPKGVPTELAIQVPLAMHAAGFPAFEIGIDYFPGPGTPLFIQDQAQLLRLKAAAESLQVFSFQCSMKCFKPAEDISSAATYIGVVLESAHLQVLTLSFPFSHDFDGQIGSLLASLRWPTLQEVNLTMVSFRLTDLKTFVEGLRPGVFLNLSSIHLLSGTWAEGLDIFRAKANAKFSVCSFSGAESDTRRLCHQWSRIFGGGYSSWANRYVRGDSARNPFLMTDDEIADEASNSGNI